MKRRITDWEGRGSWGVEADVGGDGDDKDDKI